MKNISIWQDEIIPDYPSLEQNLDLDVLIIGGGITGISSLYHLKDSNLKIALVEQNKIGLGITAKSTGKLCYLQNDLLDKIRNFYNDKIASYYLKSQIEAINKIVNIINNNKIDCNLQKTSAYLYTNNENEIPKIKNLELFLKNNNIKVTYPHHNIVKSKYMIEVEDTYLINPYRFIHGLIKSNTKSIYENTRIKKIKRIDNSYICYTDEYIIKTKKIIIASHYPYFLVPLFFPLKVSLEKSYLSASKMKIDNISLISYSNKFISIRNYQDYLIYLCNSHSLNKHLCDREQFNELIKKIHDLDLIPSYLWSNIDIITSDGLPYIGKIKKGIYLGTGYNTWGLTNGFLAGEILSDMVLGYDNKYEALFNPKRRNIKQF